MSATRPGRRRGCSGQSACAATGARAGLEGRRWQAAGPCCDIAPAPVAVQAGGAAVATAISYAMPMLTRLAIRDFAVVAVSELAFGPGLTVISGETGAGKSLRVGALGALPGLRADSAMVRHGAQRAELVAEFALDDAPAARAWLVEAEFDDGEDCQLRRTLRADGGSRAWINGRPATIAQLGELAALLVEIHGQHEHQALLSRASQLALLDAFGGLDPQVSAVRGAARDWSTL